MGDGGHGADVERLGVGAVHGVAGAQQAPVEVLVRRLMAQALQRIFGYRVRH